MAQQTWKQVRTALASDAELSANFGDLRRLALTAIAWLLVNEILIVLEIYPLKALVDTLSTQPLSLPSALRLAVLIGLLYTVTSIVHYLMDRRRLKFFWRLWSLMWGFGHRVEQRQSVAWHKRHSTGDKESIMSKNVNKLEFFLDDATFEASPAILRILATATGITVFLGWVYGALVFLTIVVFLVVSWRSNLDIQAERQAARQAERFVERFGTEMTTNWRTLKFFGMEQQRCAENQGHLGWFQQSGYTRDIKMIGSIFWQENVVNVSRLILVLLIIWEFQRGSTTVGAAVLAFTWMQQVYNNFYRLSAFQRRINETMEPLRELTELVLNQPEITQPERPAWPDLRGEVEFRQVTFAYEQAEKPAVADFDLVVPPNTTVAIVGRSGSGKSTLAELIARSYDPSSGAVLIDGVDLREIDYDRFRLEVQAIVAQDAQLWDMSIGDNIRFGRTDASDEEVQFAARQAYVHDFIMSLPQGYDTMVGENGIRLSGGQKQRIAIARALVRQPRILILDEATSALDAESQHHVKQAIDRLIADRACTIFVIAHRLSTVREADIIVVMDDGRISECGTHAELLRGNGFYSRIAGLESDGTLDEH